jgi:hypothetical protein
MVVFKLLANFGWGNVLYLSSEGGREGGYEW